MSEVFVIGGGPSLVGFNFAKLENRNTIAINKAAFIMKNPTYFITMDYTFLKKVGYQRVTALNSSKFFAVNISSPYIVSRGGVIQDTRPNCPVYDKLYDCVDSVIICRKDQGMGLSFHDFRCGNHSGYCGIQLAVALGYTKIYLLGFDLQMDKTRTHFHSGYGNKRLLDFSQTLSNYAKVTIAGLQELKKLRPDIEVYNCSTRSVLSGFIPHKSIDEVLR